MSLSVKEKTYWLDVVKNTGGQREVMLKNRTVPHWYAAYSQRVDRKEITLPVEAVGIPVRCYIITALDKEENCPVFINMHGGGFLIPRNEDDELFCAHIAAETGGIVVDVDYALSNPHPFPVALEQCYAVAKWVFAQCEAWGAHARRVSIGGHSAGGNLAAAVALRANQTGEFRLCMQLLDYAALDYSEDPDDSMAERMEGEGFPADRSRAITALYVGGNEYLTKSPFVSPLQAPDQMLAGLPDAVIVTAQHCPFRGQANRYGRRMAEQGVAVTIKRYMNSRHGFAVRMMDEWADAQKYMIRVIREASARQEEEQTCH